MKEIPLSRGRVALVDDEDFDQLSRWKWYGDREYAWRRTLVAGVQTKVYMHQQILGIKGIDHRNRNGLDNRRENLRPANQSQNTANSGHRQGGTSRFRGVYLHRARKVVGEKVYAYEYWVAKIQVRRRQTSLGCFKDEEAAARAYDQAALAAFGEFATLNFPP